MKSDEKTRSMETSEMLAGELLLRVDEMEATVVEHSRRVDQSLSTATAQAAQHLEDVQQRMRRSRSKPRAGWRHSRSGWTNR